MVSGMQLFLEPNEFEFCATENRVCSVEHIVFFTNLQMCGARLRTEQTTYVYKLVLLSSAFIEILYRLLFCSSLGRKQHLWWGNSDLLDVCSLAHSAESLCSTPALFRSLAAARDSTAEDFNSQLYSSAKPSRSKWTLLSNDAMWWGQSDGTTRQPGFRRVLCIEFSKMNK